MTHPIPGTIFPVDRTGGPDHAAPSMAPGTTLVEAREWVSENLHDGLVCPCCDQYAKVYRRRINAGQARSLIRLYHMGSGSPHGWVHVRDLGAESREEGKLVHWGLVEEGSTKPDGGRGGYWRITAMGRDFVRGAIMVPKYIWMYNAKPMEYSTTEMVSIIDVLDDPFLYSELMGRTA